MMKKSLFAVIAASLLCANAHAEGYQCNSLSAKQIGMGHTGIALKLGSESGFFNPAGMAFMDHAMDISGSITALMPTATATLPNGKKYETDNGATTPLMANAAFSIYPNLKAGISFYTPYGNSNNWTYNWPGAMLAQEVSLKMFTLQPTVAWRITPKLSVGVGLMMTWATVDLTKGIVPAASIDAMLGKPVFGEVSPANINLTGTANIRLGANIGVMYDVLDNLTVAANFRTKQTLKVGAGNAHVIYANSTVEQLLGSTIGLMNNANFAASMPAPWVLGFGASYKPVSKLTLAFDARLTGWNAYKSLDIDFLVAPVNNFNQHIVKDYKNSWAFSFGAQYAVTNRFDVRCGMMIDTTPCNDKHYNPETPGMTKIEPTVGLSFRPLSGLEINAGFMYVAGLGKDGASCDYNDPVTQTTQVFTADYKLHAIAPSLGISYRF